MNKTEGAALVVGVALLTGMWWQRVKLFAGVRGLRNNNPGNIERNSIMWDGMKADQSADSRFVVFESPEYGIRAMARILTSYRRQGFNIIGQIINRWAPAHENNTAAYVVSVAERTGIAINDPIVESDYPGLIAAIIHHENGLQPYSAALINRGVSMA